jgi:hypothetical protein
MKTHLSGFFLGVAASLVLVASAFGEPAKQVPSKPADRQAVRQLDISVQPWTGEN